MKTAGSHLPSPVARLVQSPPFSSPHPYCALGPGSLGTAAVGAPAPRSSLPATRALLPSSPGRTHFRRMWGERLPETEVSGGPADGNQVERLFPERAEDGESPRPPEFRRAGHRGPAGTSCHLPTPSGWRCSMGMEAGLARHNLSSHGVGRLVAGSRVQPRLRSRERRFGFSLFLVVLSGWLTCSCPRVPLQARAGPGPFPIIGVELGRANPKSDVCGVTDHFPRGNFSSPQSPQPSRHPRLLSLVDNQPTTIGRIYAIRPHVTNVFQSVLCRVLEGKISYYSVCHVSVSLRFPLSPASLAPSSLSPLSLSLLLKSCDIWEDFWVTVASYQHCW
jgi:hypothetical protein